MIYCDDSNAYKIENMITRSQRIAKTSRSNQSAALLWLFRISSICLCNPLHISNNRLKKIVGRVLNAPERLSAELQTQTDPNKLSESEILQEDQNGSDEDGYESEE